MVVDVHVKISLVVLLQLVEKLGFMNFAICEALSNIMNKDTMFRLALENLSIAKRL